MTFDRAVLASLVFALAAGCSSSSSSDEGGGDDGGGPSGSSSGTSSGADGSSSGSGDATASSSSGGSSGVDGSRDGSGSDSGSSGASSSGSSSGSGSGGTDAGNTGALAGGSAAVDAFCAAGCNRASACAMMDASAGTVDVATCTSSCMASNGGEETLYRADYWAADTSCVSTASCADTLSGVASRTCSSTALAGVVADQDVVAFCGDVENASADGGCVSPVGCLSTYKVLSDATVQALTACFLSPTFCSDPDAGAGCFTAALTPP